MFGKLSLVALIAASLAAAQSSLQINSPSQIRTCIPVNINWTGGSAPYYLQVLQGGSQTNQLEDLGEQTGTSYTWDPNLAAGTSITLGLTDSAGNTAYTSAVTITAGPSTSCVGQSASAGATSATSSGTSTGTTTGSSSSSSSHGTDSSSHTGSSTSTSSHGSSSSSGSSPSSSSNSGNSSGAMGLTAGLASVAGVAAAVFLA